MSLASFLLAFTLGVVAIQYLFQGVTESNRPYVFAFVVFVFYFVIQLCLQMAQVYLWPHFKTSFATETAIQLNEQAQQALQSWHTHLLHNLEQAFGITKPVVLIYDVAQRRYQPLFAETSASLPANHALVYVAKQSEYHVIDETIMRELPEVTALDIQWIMKQYRANQVIPIGVERGTVCGFIFCSASTLTQVDGEKITKQFGMVLSQIIQHGAVTRPVNSLDIKPPRMTWPVGVTLVSFILLTIYWVITLSLTKFVNKDSFTFDFSDVYGMVAAWGGIWALLVAKQWKKSLNISRALLFFGVGLLLQEFGQIAYSVYSEVWGIVIPYPSIGDIGYFGSMLSYLIAVIFLAKASGVTLRLKSLRAAALAFFIPVIFLSASFFLFLQGAELDINNPLKLFLDLGYPIFDAVYVSIAILTYLLTRDSGGKLRSQVFMILLALIWQFACDFVFIYQASQGTWAQNGFNDYMYFVSYVLMTLAILRFRHVEPKL